MTMNYNYYKQYLMRCRTCGSNTSKKYGRNNGGMCKACATGNSTVVRLNPVSKAYSRRYRDFDPEGQDGETFDDVYEHMSARDLAMNDRLDYANHVVQYDPEMAAEIRMGA